MVQGKPVVLDHNFPQPIIQAISPFIPDIDFRPIVDLPGELETMADRDLVYELARRRCPVFVTQDHHMLADVGVLVAIQQTRMTVVAIQDSGHDPIRATGVLLRDLLDVLKQDKHAGLAYRVRPSRIKPTESPELIGELEPDPDAAVAAYGLPFDERQRYPDGDERLLR